MNRNHPVCLSLHICLSVYPNLQSLDICRSYRNHNLQTTHTVQYSIFIHFFLSSPMTCMWHNLSSSLPNLTLYCYLITSVSPIFVLCVSGYIQLYILHLCRYTCFHTVCQKVIYTVLSFVDISLFCFLFVLFVFYRQSIL